MDPQAKGKIVVTDRKSTVLDGVENVLSFDEGYILLATSLGELTVEGEGLKIENLSKESGEITVSGRICALYYKDKNMKKRKAF